MLLTILIRAWFRLVRVVLASRDAVKHVSATDLVSYLGGLAAAQRPPRITQPQRPRDVEMWAKSEAEWQQREMLVRAGRR